MAVTKANAGVARYAFNDDLAVMVESTMMTYNDDTKQAYLIVRSVDGEVYECHDKSLIGYVLGHFYENKAVPLGWLEPPRKKPA